MTKSLILLAHASTRATRTSSFPADEPLETLAGSQLSPDLCPRRWSAATARVSPRQAAGETAISLGIDATIDPDLDDLNYGEWSGRTIADIAATEPAQIKAWLSDPSFDGHGGESRLDLSKRLARILEGYAAGGSAIIAVTHAPVIRMAILLTLGADHDAFWRLDIAPLTASELSHDGRRWSLRSSSVPMRR